MIFIISTSFDKIDSNGQFFWSEKYLPGIKKFIPSAVLDILSINSAILCFIKANQKEKFALNLKISGTQITQNYFRLNYTIEDELQFKSFQIRDALKKYFKIQNITELPFCVSVEKELFYDTINSSGLSAEIIHLESNNNWKGIYDILKKYLPLEKSVIWNDAQLLNKFSFATAKLSECSINIKKKFSDNEKREKFLSEKRNYRELTIKMREQCIHLNPNNPSYYANMAYTYYQFSSELSAPNNRRDGNLKKNANLALFFIDKAIELEPKRISEYYRKGVILSEILDKHTAFNKTASKENIIIPSLPEKLQQDSAHNFLLSGIDSFAKVIDIYKGNNLTDEEKKRFKKYFVKSLYNLAKLNLMLGKISINFSIFNNKLYINEYDKTQTEVKSTYLNFALNYIDHCIFEDKIKTNTELLIDAVESNNIFCAVHKAYLKGIIHLHLYILTKDKEHCKTAKEFLYLANEIKFPTNLQNQNKLFIFEKLAFLNIISNKPNLAVSLLEIHYQRNKFFPDYAAYTLAIAYILDNKISLAKEIIQKYIQKKESTIYFKFETLDNIFQDKSNIKSYLFDIINPNPDYKQTAYKTLYSKNDN